MTCLLGSCGAPDNKPQRQTTDQASPTATVARHPETQEAPMTATEPAMAPALEMANDPSTSDERDSVPKLTKSFSANTPNKSIKRPKRVRTGLKSATVKRESQERPRSLAYSPKAPRDDKPDYYVAEVYYGTDRAAVDGSNPKNITISNWHWASAALSVGTILLLIVAYVGWHTKLIMVFAILGIIATVATSIHTMQKQHALPHSQTKRAYGHMRGSMELGMCKVSIPKDHKVGELESPSIFHFEFKQDPTKHVVLLDVTEQPADAFYANLKKRVAQSSDKEAFVFVHGYNVTFDDAARRTAQIAYDLKFDGAPIFFSWPSQGGLLSYAVDETNVVWAVPHLRKFLTDIAERSGARNLHLIAHSMGNRALTSALRDLSIEMSEKMPMFREVVLTAPDIDAEVFRRDIVPAIRKTANRVTLYASSNDEALIASKTFHGYPRAGDSGGDVVVIDGIDTIDVSDVDTSLLGHCYYGTNDTVLIDLAQLLREALPPDKRTRLRSIEFGALKYWIFLKNRLEIDRLSR